jgi:fructose-1,6-bisphosphatase/inositol monophosphatase family enzyme
MRTLNIDKISEILREVATEIVLPRFRALETGEIELKPSASDPNDIVTVVDHEVEEWMTRVLRGLDPSFAVVGEEGVYADPTILQIRETSDPYWLLDPIDGTKNFARGEDGFGIMLARVQRGEVMASWIYLPVEDRLFAAELGSGAYLEGERIRTPSRSAAHEALGALHLRYMPSDLAETVSSTLIGRVGIAPDMGCAAMEYTRILMGEREFAIYHRLHPWDHSPGALILTEGGGRVEHLDGAAYGPRSTDQITVVAHDPALAEDLRGWLRDVPPGDGAGA